MRVHSDPRMIYFSWLFITNWYCLQSLRPWGICVKINFIAFLVRLLLLSSKTLKSLTEKGRISRVSVGRRLLTNFIPSQLPQTYQYQRICQVTAWGPWKNGWEPLTLKGPELGLCMDWKCISKLPNTAPVHWYRLQSLSVTSPEKLHFLLSHLSCHQQLFLQMISALVLLPLPPFFSHCALRISYCQSTFPWMIRVSLSRAKLWSVRFPASACYMATIQETAPFLPPSYVFLLVKPSPRNQKDPLQGMPE